MRRSSYSGLAALAAVFIAVCCWGSENPAGRWIVKFKTEKSAANHPSSPTQVIQGLQLELATNLATMRSQGSTLKQPEPLWVANAVAITASAEEIKKLATLPNIECVYPVRYRRWLNEDHAQDVSATANTVQWSIKKVRAPEVWDKFKIDGSGVVVGHIDSGVDTHHPLLAGKVLAFKDFTPHPSTQLTDEEGHGTHTAGTICGLGGVGIAPGAKLIVGKVFDADGSADDETVLRAMQWIMDPDGNPATNDFPRVVSNSWGDTPEDETATDARVLNQAVQNWVAMGMIPVFSAGNDGPSGHVGRPACFPSAWAVGATDSSDRLSSFSSIGPSRWNGVSYVKPDVSAPGSGVISCKAGSTGLVSMDGTSMACPHAAGLVALMLQANPKLTFDEVRKKAEATVIDLGNPGKDNKFGSGRIDCFACLSAIAPQTPLANLVEGYKAALETEAALTGGIGPVSPLAAPMAHYLVEKAGSLDEGEFSALRNRYSGDIRVKDLLNQMTATRNFDSLHK
ncbi:MAG: S8 family serine peptidase [Candidatus Riflebacteria bacterium]|nr:S8 family serine peptidase [Candidatus Riflebacteria bacterium]